MPVLGFDIGGTTAEVALVEEGEILDRQTVTTGRGRRPEELLDALAETALALSGGGRGGADAAGIGIAGQVTADHRRLGFAPNLDWRDVPLADLMEDRLPVPVFLLNDVQAAALAEASRGAGRDTGEVLVVYVGTGVGGGMVADGELRRGCAGCAGEVGHIMIVHDGRECRCGARGCLEAYVGGWAIAERAREAVAEDPRAGEALLEAAGERDAITARTVSIVAGAGDALGRRLVRSTADYLGSGLASLINVVSPCALVLGGGVGLNMPGLLDRAGELALDRALAVPAGQVEIRRARIGEHAGVIGAADWAARRVHD